MATQCVMRVPDRYMTVGETGYTDFTFTMYNQDYSISYKFAASGYKSKNMAGLLIPNYDITDSLVLYTERIYNFNLSVSEKTTMENFLYSFNNSFQPFQMTITVDATSQSDTLYCILNEDPGFEKDIFNRWTVSLGLIEASSISVDYS